MTRRGAETSAESEDHGHNRVTPSLARATTGADAGPAWQAAPMLPAVRAS
jgi:hypothetical protein